ncbi:MAG: MXAN_5187 C-terminal domain-containing protein [Myxococcota bacterium]
MTTRGLARPDLLILPPVAVKKKDRNLFGGGGRGAEEDEAQRLRRQDKELAQEIEALDKSIDELRAAYELYFMGVEKLEPQPQRDLVKSRLRRFQAQKPRNTALKFRFQQLKARMVSLENYWQRTLRQKEAGTYHRDVARARRREAEREKRAALSKPESTDNLPASSPSLRPRATSAEDLTDDKLQRLYKTYLGARRRCGESADLRFDDMASTLRKQVPKLMAKTGASSVEFKVVIKGGKAVLKAMPKTE